MAEPSRVLLVDDEPAPPEIGRLFLERSGVFSAETSDTAEDVLDLLASGRMAMSSMTLPRAPCPERSLPPYVR